MAVTNTKASATLVTARIYYSSLVVLDSEHFSVADEILAIFASFFGGKFLLTPSILERSVRFVFFPSDSGFLKLFNDLCLHLFGDLWKCFVSLCHRTSNTHVIVGVTPPTHSQSQLVT